VAGLTVLDASIIVAYFTAADEHHDDALMILREADALAASALTVTEALVEPVRKGDIGPSAVLGELGIRLVPIDENGVLPLARLRAETNLKVPDCCVIHAAAVLDADAIGTRDRRLGKAARELGFATP
jgi:predicted nucleic acid-binding protein